MLFLGFIIPGKVQEFLQLYEFVLVVDFVELDPCKMYRRFNQKKQWRAQ